MVRRKSLALFLLVGLTALCLAGCAGDEKFSKNPTDDAEQASGGEAENPFGPGAADGGIPIEGDETTAEEKQPAATAAKAAVIKPVEITKAGGSLGACVIGGACEKKISAKGGSGAYTWALIEGALPSALDLVDAETKKVKIQKTEGQEIDEIGEFTFKLKVEDQADAERSAERQFTLTIKENIAIVFYTKYEDEGGNPVWRAVEETDAEGNALPITVPPNGLLLIEVIGHAETYKWSIGGTEIVCNDQSCEGTREGLTLYKDTNLAPPEPRPAHFAYMILKAEEDFIGQTAQNVVIAARDDFDNAASKTISSITFQQDPCTIPLTITGGADGKKKRGEEYSFTFSVSGGNGLYSWFQTDIEGGSQTPTSAVEGANFTVTGTVPADADINKEIEFAVVAKDSCSQQNDARRVVAVSIDYPALEEEEITDIRLWAKLKTDYTDDESEVRFRVYVGNTLVASNDTGINGEDPDTWAQFFPLTFTGEAQGKKVGEITEVTMTVHDNPDAWFDLEWSVGNFYLIGKDYYAVDKTGDGGNEVDSTDDVMTYTFSSTPGGEPDLHNFMDVEGGQVWRVCEKEAGCIDPS